MKITRGQLRRIIKESMSDARAAQEAGYNDAIRNRPHGSNPDMRDLDPRAYDYGFDKGTADRMDMQRQPQFRRQRMSESVMSRIHIEIQNAIAEAVDDLTMDPAQHGTTIEDIHMYISGSNIQFSHGYVPDMEEVEQIVYDMVDAGELRDDGRGYLMLTSDY